MKKPSIVRVEIKYGIQNQSSAHLNAKCIDNILRIVKNLLKYPFVSKVQNRTGVMGHGCQYSRIWSLKIYNSDISPESAYLCTELLGLHSWV